jgi:hypothetical protein
MRVVDVEVAVLAVVARRRLEARDGPRRVELLLLAVEAVAEGEHGGAVRGDGLCEGLLGRHGGELCEVKS